MAKGNGTTSTPRRATAAKAASSLSQAGVPGLVTGWVSLAWPNDGVDHPAPTRNIAATKYGKNRADFPASFMVAPRIHQPKSWQLFDSGW